MNLALSGFAVLIVMIDCRLGGKVEKGLGEFIEGVVDENMGQPILRFGAEAEADMEQGRHAFSSASEAANELGLLILGKGEQLFEDRIGEVFLLAMLCTESPREVVPHKGVNYYVATGPRSLPQGASISPALTNVLCLKLDQRLTGLAESMGWRYTRYADDLTFSIPRKSKKDPKEEP